ncbi:hypothetical protein C8Q75DRAFT_743507 [Abortiporus biennis]|nr:hypothetical protein C8Q75DRAFT_743507 [Abortiporus biennis]
MKLFSALVSLSSLSVLVNAQYFSEGWKPGQAHPPRDAQWSPPPPSQTGSLQDSVSPQSKATSSPASLFDVTNILQSGPVASLFGKFGINVTEGLEVAKARVEQQSKVWDERIPLITDDNYEDIIVNEQFESPEEEEKRLWFVIITAQTGQSSAMSKFSDEAFDSAFNTSLVQGDLPDVKWARIDYLNVTYLTTKWSVWKAPYLMVIRNRGKDLYFYQATQIRLNEEILRDFLLNEQWKQTHKWDTALSPGGSYEYIMHYFAVFLTKLYNVMVVIPKWLLMIISGAVASLVMRLMHSNPESELPKPTQTVEENKVVEQPKVEEKKTPSTPKKSSGKGSKKNGKK